MTCTWGELAITLDREIIVGIVVSFLGSLMLVALTGVVDGIKTTFGSFRRRLSFFFLERLVGTLTWIMMGIRAVFYVFEEPAPPPILALLYLSLGATVLVAVIRFRKIASGTLHPQGRTR